MSTVANATKFRVGETWETKTKIRYEVIEDLPGDEVRLRHFFSGRHITRNNVPGKAWTRIK